jgi:hypothetical protein
MAPKCVPTAEKVQVSLPLTTARALERYVSSSRGNATTNKSIPGVLGQLLAKGLQEAKGDDRFALLWLAREAVAKTTPGGSATTLERIRARLKTVPRVLLDSALRELERRGELRLEPSDDDASLTQAERAAGLRDGARGLLTYVVPEHRSVRSVLSSPSEATRQRSRAS